MELKELLNQLNESLEEQDRLDERIDRTLTQLTKTILN